jgi:hypothetical protein
MPSHSVEISVKGKWFTVPALLANGKAIVRKGHFLKTAYVHNEEWLETAIVNPHLCIETLKAQASKELRADVFTFCQKPPSTERQYPYPIEKESVAVVHINSFEEWWASLPQETRKNARRAQKRGVVVGIQELDATLLRGLLELNNDSPIRQGKAYTHYGKSLQQVERDQQDFLDRSDYICAYFGEELVGVVKLVYRGDVASILTFLSKSSHNDKRPANALMAKVVEVCAQKRISCLTFGLFNYGNKRDTSLRDFKIRNGFEEMLVPRYFVPLTLKGALAVRLKLHRGLVGLLPGGIINVLVGIRSKLFSLRSRCSSMLERPNRNRQMGRSNPPAGSNL